MFLFYWMVALVLAIWMLVRIWRTSPLLAVLSFLVPLVIVIAVFRMWGNPDSDIRLPFIASLVVAALMFHSIPKEFGDEGYWLDPSAIIVDDSYLPLSPEELAQLREEHPAVAVAVERRQAELMAQPGWSERQGREPMSYPSGVVAKSSSARSTSEPDPVVTRLPPTRDAEAERLGGLRTYSQVPVKFDSVRLDEARATLQLPQRYRFVESSALAIQSRLRGVGLGSGTQGWILHESARLSEPDIWFVEVAFLPIGYLDGLDFMAARASEETMPDTGSEHGEWAEDSENSGHEAEPFPPHWDAEQGYATWVVRQASGENGATASAFALRPLRHGALLFRVDGLTPERVELGLRASRLMASRTRSDVGWRHQDHDPRRDQRASQSLHELMAQGPVLAALSSM